MDGGPALILIIAGHNKRVRESLSGEKSPAPISAISRLEELREKSLARRRDSSPRSRSSSESSPPTSGGDSDFVDDYRSTLHLASILEEGFGPGAVSPARIVASSLLGDKAESSSELSESDSDFASGDKSRSELASTLDEGIRLPFRLHAL